MDSKETSRAILLADLISCSPVQAPKIVAYFRKHFEPNPSKQMEEIFSAIEQASKAKPKTLYHFMLEMVVISCKPSVLMFADHVKASRATRAMRRTNRLTNNHR